MAGLWSTNGEAFDRLVVMASSFKLRFGDISLRALQWISKRTPEHFEGLWRRNAW